MLAARFPNEPRLRYVEERRPGGSRARNRGLAAAQGEIIAFTDDDVVVDAGWIRASVDPLASAPGVACVTGLILPLELGSDSQLLLEQFAGFGKGFRRHTYRLPDSRKDNPLLPYAAGAIGSGASIVIRTDIARELGGFDPVLGPATAATGGEDLDLLIRVLRSGHAVLYEPGAIVSHEHPGGARQLRRQVYRYGVGLGAMLTKQLVAGPQRRDLVRMVPAGLRYFRDSSSRKNAGKPEHYPRHLTWLERVGLVIGPLAYMISALRGLSRRWIPPAQPIHRMRRLAQAGGGFATTLRFDQRILHSRQRLPPEGATGRAIPRPRQPVVLGAAVACVAAPLLVALGAPAALRMAAVLAFLCLVPGTAFLTAVRGRLEPGLVVGVSTAAAAVIAQSMLWLHAFLPRTFLYCLAAICLVPLARNVKLNRLRTGANWRIAGYPSRLTRLGSFRGAALHVTLLALALALWGVSLLAADLSRMGGIGLLDAVPPTYFVAFALLLMGFAVAAAGAERRPALLGAYVLALVVVLHATTALLYQEPRYAWVYKHLGVINLIARTGAVNRDIDIYNNWPAFFATNAWLTRTGGITPIAYAGWAQVFFNLWYVYALRFALRALTSDERLLWTAALLFVLGNWVGQDYLAPQAFGFATSLVVLGLCLRCGRGVTSSAPLGRGAALVVGGVCFVAVVASHQLSPVVLIVDVACLALFVRRVPLWVPVVMAAIEAWWLASAWSFFHLHFSLFQPGAGGAATPDRNLGAALPGAVLSFYAPAAVMALVAGIAVVGIVRRWRAGHRDVGPLCLIGAPIVTAAAQSYGGEGAYRAYLFALPWLAFFAAATFSWSPSRDAGARIRFRPLAAITSVLGACLLFAYFGQELANRISRDDVRASTWYEQHAPPRSVQVDLAPNAPTRLTSRYPLVSLNDPSSLLETPGFVGHRLGASDIPRLERVIQQQGGPASYVVLSASQEAYARLNGLLPPGSLSSLTSALERSGSFALVYRRPTAWVFEYAPPRQKRAT